MKIFLDTSIVIDVLTQRQDFYTKDIFYGDIDDFQCQLFYDYYSAKLAKVLNCKIFLEVFCKKLQPLCEISKFQHDNFWKRNVSKYIKMFVVAYQVFCSRNKGTVNKFVIVLVVNNQRPMIIDVIFFCLGKNQYHIYNHSCNVMSIKFCQNLFVLKQNLCCNAQNDFPVQNIVPNKAVLRLFGYNLNKAVGVQYNPLFHTIAPLLL